MPRFAANLTLLFPDSPFLERFARAKAFGFHACEYLFPYEFDPDTLVGALNKNDLSQVLFNFPPGDWARGERGLASLPDRIDEFRNGVSQAIEYARVLGVTQLNCLAGKRDASMSIQDQQRVLIENLRFAADACSEHSITLLIEMLNPYDVPEYMIPTPQAAFELQETIARPNVKVLFDVYHAQRSQGELTNTIKNNISRIGHIQIADNPGRHQPGTGEINYRFLFQMLDQIGYQSWVGLEYIPEGTTEESLAWVKEHGCEL